MGLTPTAFRNTMEGQELIQSQKPFVLGGSIWQGFSGIMAGPFNDTTLTDEELESIQDVDGTKSQVLRERQNRLGQRTVARERELAEREKARIASKRDALELEIMQRQEAERKAAIDETPTQPSAPPTVAGIYCEACDREFKDARGLAAHNRFKHKDSG